MAKCPLCDYPYAKLVEKNVALFNGLKWHLQCPNCGHEAEDWQEGNGPSALFQGKLKRTACFVATAVYNDYNHPVVYDLRCFRDNWLLKKSGGKKFVNWYYKNGPYFACFISKNKIRRKIALFLIIKPLHFSLKVLRLIK